MARHWYPSTNCHSYLHYLSVMTNLLSCTPPLKSVPFPVSTWGKFALTIIDYYSKSSETVFVSTRTSATLITFFSPQRRQFKGTSIWHCTIHVLSKCESLLREKNTKVYYVQQSPYRSSSNCKSYYKVHTCLQSD